MKRVFALILLWPGLAWSAPLELPEGAAQTIELRDGFASYQVPTGPFLNGRVKAVPVEGEVVKEAWRLKSLGGKTLEYLAPLRNQLLQAGYEVIFECSARDCGGFDFRFAADVLPAPEMYVDLDNFRFLSAQRSGEGTPEYVTLLVSASQSEAFIQVVTVGPTDTTPRAISTSTKATPDIDETPLGTALIQNGHFVLSDLTFATGSAALEDRKFPSLAALAEFLKADPERHVVLVGHTDAVGSLEANIDLSRKRARSVADRLINSHSVSRGQVDADGVGFLSPLASNLESDGRKMNRRVEVVLTTTR